MDLTILRNYCLREIKKLPSPHNKVTIEEIDDAINLVQETYIQPVALKKGTADYVARGEKVIAEEELSTTDDLTYGAEFKPFKYGTVKVYVDESKVNPIDEEGNTVFTINHSDGEVVFEDSQTGKEVTANYTAHEIIEKASLTSDDIYKITNVRDITYSMPGQEVAFYGVNDTPYMGARSIQEQESSLHFKNIEKNTVLRFYYEKKLKPLGEDPENEVTVPEIPAGWHNLYWMGALAQFDMERLPMFLDRLEAYTREQRDIKDTYATRVKNAW